MSNRRRDIDRKKKLARRERMREHYRRQALMEEIEKCQK